MKISNNLIRWRMGLFCATFASLTIGIALQQAFLFSLLLFQLGLALVYGMNLGSLFGKGRRTALILFGAIILAALVAQVRNPQAARTSFHWAFISFWVVVPIVSRKVNWDFLHRLMVGFSLPGMGLSLYQMGSGWQQGSWGGFPEGLVSSPVTNSETLAIIACWSLNRLTAKVSARERLWIWLHLGVSCVIIAGSGFLAGPLVLVLISLVKALTLNRYRVRALALWLAFVFLMILASDPVAAYHRYLHQMIPLARQSLVMWQKFPIFGSGPGQMKRVEVEGFEIPGQPPNTLLGFLVECGLLGLSAYLAFMAALAWRLWRLRQAFRYTRLDLDWVSQSLVYVFLSYWLFGLFDFNFGDTELLLAHGFHWGLISQLSLKIGLPSYSRGKEPTLTPAG